MADDQNLTSPLLSTTNGTHYIITFNDHHNQNGNPTHQPSIDQVQDSPFQVQENFNHDKGINLDEENPYGFLGVPEFEVPRPITIDPFRNNTPRIEGFYEWVKILVCLPIALVRLVLFGLCLALGYVATRCALHGWKDKENPMPKWRCRLMGITRLCTRGILFSFGFVT